MKQRSGASPLDGSGRTEEGNLLALAVEAARHRATVGEISDALEQCFGRFVASAQTVSGYMVHMQTKAGNKLRWT